MGVMALVCYSGRDPGHRVYNRRMDVTRRHLLTAIGLSGLVLVLPGTTPGEAGTLAPTRAARRAALFGARNWVSFYQSPAPPGTRAALKRFDYVDLDADQGNFDDRAHAKAVVGDLRQDRRLVLSYLNIGAAEKFRWYWKQAERFKLHPYAGWPGEYWMDVTKTGWRDVILDRVAPVLEATGVDGFYLDNIDVSARYPKAAFRAGVVELVRRLRERFPQLLLIGQSYEMAPYNDKGSDGRRFFEYLDGTSKEEVNSSYQGGYHLVPKAASDEMLAELRVFRDHGLHVTVLDYAKDRDAVAYCTRRCVASDLLPFVSVRDLDSTKLWDRQAPGRPGKPRLSLIGNGDGVLVEWAAAPDDMGVSRYDVFRDGKRAGSTRLTRFQDSRRVRAATGYRIRAWDTGRNGSALSAETSIGPR